MADDTSNDTGDNTELPAGGDESTEHDGEMPEGAKKALDAARRDAREANKRAKSFEAKVRAYDDRDKTETQKLTERAELAEKAANDAGRKALRLEIAVDKQVPRELVDRLQGDTSEEMAADADRLLALFKPGRPRGSADQGARTSDAPPSMNDFLRAAAGRG